MYICIRFIGWSQTDSTYSIIYYVQYRYLYNIKYNRLKHIENTTEYIKEKYNYYSNVNYTKCKNNFKTIV